jgi:hypothetical protein
MAIHGAGMDGAALRVAGNAQAVLARRLAGLFPAGFRHA